MWRRFMDGESGNGWWDDAGDIPGRGNVSNNTELNSLHYDG